MKNIFHIATKPSGMIAWNIKGKAVLIDNEHFHELVKKYLSDLDDGDQNLNMFALRITTHMMIGDESIVNKFQKILNDRLLNETNSGRINFMYSFSRLEAQSKLEDYLEVYKFNTGNIFYGIGKLHDGTDEIINISLRKKPSLFQKLRGLLGDPTGEINLLKSEVSEIIGGGTSFKIILTSGTCYLLNENGISNQCQS
jgi:hypothetical protein